MIFMNGAVNDGNLKIVQRHAAPLQKIESSEEKPKEKGNNNE